MTSTNKRDGGEVELLPLLDSYQTMPGLYNANAMQAYARANVERALAESRAEVDSLRSRLEDTTRDKLNAEARAERLAGLLREVSRNGWGKQSLEDGMHKTPLLQRIDAALEQEPQE